MNKSTWDIEDTETTQSIQRNVSPSVVNVDTNDLASIPSTTPKTNRWTAGKVLLIIVVCFVGGCIVAAIVVVPIILTSNNTQLSSTTISSTTVSTLTTTTQTTTSASTTTSRSTTTSSTTTSSSSTTTSSTTSSSSTTTSSSTTSTTTSTTTTTTTSITTTTSSLLRWNSTGITVAGVVGVPGTAPNQLYYPFGLFVDSSNTLYIADWQNSRVQKWLYGASNGTTVAGQSNGATGSNSSFLDAATSVAVDSSGNLYVSDIGNARIQFWSNGATSGTTVAGTSGVLGSANNQLNYPYSISLDSSTGTLYIADFNNHRVMRYLSGASSGTVVAGGNGPGTNSTQLYNPVGVCYDASSNSVVIANYGANNVVRWVIGASSWTLVGGNRNGAGGSSSTELFYPLGVTVDSSGNVYVADGLNYRIQLFLVGQLNATTIAGVTGVSGTNASLLGSPYGVALDSQRNLYVADTTNNRVQKFMRY